MRTLRAGRFGGSAPSCVLYEAGYYRNIQLLPRPIFQLCAGAQLLPVLATWDDNKMTTVLSIDDYEITTSSLRQDFAASDMGDRQVPRGNGTPSRFGDPVRGNSQESGTKRGEVTPPGPAGPTSA